MCDRIVVLVDMDCFYCQVEARYDPSLKGKPMAVVQYNQWQGGGIIAVNYEARAFGVTRHIRGNEAKKKCPEIVLVHVPSVRGKADLTRYREAGREVMDVLCQFCDTVQRASVDEAYLDVTEAVDVRYKKMNGKPIEPEQLKSTFVVGTSPDDSNDEDQRVKSVCAWLEGVYNSELRDETAEKLAVAALLMEEMRAAVLETTGFHCSAGIAHNKILSKLACGIHKPQRQTILPQSGVPMLYQNLPLKKIRGLGGKFGDVVMKRLKINYMGELHQFSETHLQKMFDEKSGSWLYNIAKGIDDEAVTSRLTSKSIGCCKKFPGRLALNTKESVEHWLNELAEEIIERLEKELAEGNRKATQFVVSYMQTIDGRDVSASRCSTLTSYERKQIVQDAMDLLNRSNTCPGNSTAWYPPLKFLGLSAGKFCEVDSKTATLENFFKSAPKKSDTICSEIEKPKLTNVESEVNALPSTPENTSTEEKDSKSSIKNSFLIKFLKQEGLILTPTSQSFEVNHKKDENDVKKSARGPMGNSQQATTSEGHKGISNNFFYLQQPDDSSNDSEKGVEHWVSPGEIFPNLDEVDENVAVLLPSPLQRILKVRIQKHQESKSIRNKKNCSKGKCKKSLKYDEKPKCNVEELEDDPRPILNCSPAGNEEKDAGCSISGEDEEKINLNQSQEDIFASNSPASCNKNLNDLDTIEDLNSESCKTNIEKTSEASENLDIKVSNNHVMDYNTSVKEVLSESSDQHENSLDCSKSFQILKEVCPHCNELISLQDYPEHLDFHVAANLDKEINQPHVISSAARNGPPPKSPQKDAFGKRKRGKPSQKTKNTPSDKKMRSITTYFAPVR